MAFGSSTQESTYSLKGGSFFSRVNKRGRWEFRHSSPCISLLYQQLKRLPFAPSSQAEVKESHTQAGALANWLRQVFYPGLQKKVALP